MTSAAADMTSTGSEVISAAADAAHAAAVVSHEPADVSHAAADVFHTAADAAHEPAFAAHEAAEKMWRQGDVAPGAPAQGQGRSGAVAKSPKTTTLSVIAAYRGPSVATSKIARS
jgi:hypothetical protein